MFDKTQGRKALIDLVDAKSDEFADRFDGLDPRVQLKVLDKLNELLDNPDHVDALQAGTFAQNSSGQPAQALGAGSSAGSPTPNDLQEALNVILAAPAATDGQKAAMTRIFFPGHDHINVEADGTPSELISTKKERDDAKNAKKAAEDKLAEEQDENKSGSLAFQLKAAKAAQAAPATPADMVEKSKVKAKVDDLKAAVAHLTAPVGKVRGKAEVDQAVDELEKLC